MKRIGCCFLGALLICIQRAGGQEPGPAFFNGDSIAAVSLNINEKRKGHINPHSKRLCCFVFLSPECPLSKNYGPLMVALQSKYGTDVGFFMIVPGRSFRWQEITVFARDYLRGHAIWNDKHKQLTAYLKATVTPEVVLLEGATGKLLYRGAPDNWAFSLGKQRPAATEHYLQNAIDQYLGGLAVAVPFAGPVGCFINDF
jgi:hypothetical protein